MIGQPLPSGQWEASFRGESAPAYGAILPAPGGAERSVAAGSESPCGPAMPHYQAWEEFTRAAEKLYLADPMKVGGGSVGPSRPGGWAGPPAPEGGLE